MTDLTLKVFPFLEQLKKNNDREWFQKNKRSYDEALNKVSIFAEILLENLRKVDEPETITGKKSLYRIYRDVRFSKNKQPYKTSWSGSFRRAGKFRRGGYYFHLEPGNTFIAGGFFGPNAEDLKLLRKHIDQDSEPLRNVLARTDIIQYFGKLRGEQVKTAPRGYRAENEEIELLRYKQFILRHQFADADVGQNDFSEKVSEGFVKLLPFFEVMSEYLTTDLNGIPIV